MTKRNPAPLTVCFGHYDLEGASRNAACFLCGVDHEMCGYVSVEEPDNLEAVDLVPLCKCCHKDADRYAVLHKLQILSLYGDRIDDSTTAH